MKFIDLKCPNCGGRLLPVAGNTKIVAEQDGDNQYVIIGRTFSIDRAGVDGQSFP